MGRLIWGLHFALMSILGATSVVGSVKKGVAVNPRAFLCDDFKALNNIAWWYDWGANLNVISEKSGCVNVTENADTYVPMTWGYGSYFSNYFIYDHAEYLLAFNEPNHHGESDIQPKEAASYWSKVEELADGRPIVSPAAAPCNSDTCNGNTTQWFDEFFKYCNNCRVDFLATHAYYCNANKTMNFLEDLYKRYNLTIWLTEFACPYAKNPKRELKYMQELLPRLEAASYIYRYAWFVSRKTKSSDFIRTAVNLLNIANSSLTTLGHFYNSFNGTTTESTTSASSTTESTTSVSSTTPRNTSYTTTSSSYKNTTTVTTFNTTSYQTTTYFVSEANRIGSFIDSFLILTAWFLVQITCNKYMYSKADV